MRQIPIALALTLAACGLESAPRQAAQTEPPPPVTLETMASHLVAEGEGWRLDSDPQAGLTLVLPEAGAVISADYAAPTRTNAGALRIASGRLALTLDARPCTQAGATYPMTAALDIAGQGARQGCAYARWDNRLPELLPAIDTCLSLQPAGAVVRYAAAEADGRALVRLASGDLRFDCHAPLDPSAGPAVTMPADPAIAPPGEADPIFVRAPGPQPGGECYAAPELHGPDGALIGWLASDEPC